MHTAHSHVAGGAGGPPQPVQSGPPDCFLLCSLQEAEGVRQSRAGANATPVAQTLFSPEEHSGSSFLPDVESLCGLTFPVDPLGSLLLPFCF